MSDPHTSIGQLLTRNGITTKSTLRSAIWSGDPRVFENHDGKTITQAAKHLSWEDFDFTRPDVDGLSRRSRVLEEVNNTALAVLGPDGNVYQLGDTVRAEVQKPQHGWGRRPDPNETATYETELTRVSELGVSLSFNPTYSNSSGKSASAKPGRDPLEVLFRSDLDEYRERLTEGTDIDIPEEVNGWTLSETKKYDRDTNHLQNNLITKMQWGNGESTYVTAEWRGGYSCWYLAVPIPGTLTEANQGENDHLYEIDVPQRVVTSREIISLAVEAMESLNPAHFQSAYDLRDVDEIDNLRDQRYGPAPVSFPKQVGDWTRESIHPYEVIYANSREMCPWDGYQVKIDMHGGVIVKNEADNVVHDRRLVERYFLNGEPYPANIDTHEYVGESRDMFEENWHYGVAFMAQSSKTRPNHTTLETLEEHTPDGVSLMTYNHGLSTNATDSQDRENGNLFAYS